MNRTLQRQLIAAILFTVSSSRAYDLKCEAPLTLPSKAKVSACLITEEAVTRETCLSSLLPSTFKIVTSPYVKSFNAKADKSYCISNVVLPAGSMLGFSSDGSFVGVIQVGSAKWRNFTFRENICGWDENGRLDLQLDPAFQFIPKTARVSIFLPNCSKNSTVTGTSITLLSDTNICGLRMKPNTSFGYGADGHYHFTALNNGMMKDGDQPIKIVKGKDYRNANPAEYPCRWRETPADVLKSFAEEHSE